MTIDVKVMMRSSHNTFNISRLSWWWRLMRWVVVLFFVLRGLSPATDILDDSQSPRKTYNIQLQWAHQGNVSDLDRQEFQKLVARVPDVEVRLDTSNYVGQNVRIFLALPAQIDGLTSADGFTLSWKTQGLFSTGTTTPGNRALIFKGRLDTSQLIGFFTFKLNVDASRLTGKLRYAPIYEIEMF
jgi:hypothetical protein